MKITPPQFARDLAGPLAEINAVTPPAVTEEMIAELREHLDAETPSLDDFFAGGGFEVSEIEVPGPEAGAGVGLLVARPVGVGSRRPVVFFVHGGGMFMGNNRLGLGSIIPWSLEFGCVIVSVEYRLAPEDPYPAGLFDAYAGLVWTAEHAEEIGADPNLLLLAGASAGGGIAAGLSLLARDRGGPRPIGQVLMYPMLDDRNNTVSSLQMADLGVWDRTANETGWTALLGSDRRDGEVSDYAAPARADDLSGLPPTFLDVGTAETFRDEVIQFAARIAQAGGDVELHAWPGGFHAFSHLAPDADMSRDAVEARRRWLRRLMRDVGVTAPSASDPAPAT